MPTAGFRSLLFYALKKRKSLYAKSKNNRSLSCGMKCVGYLLIWFIPSRPNDQRLYKLLARVIFFKSKVQQMVVHKQALLLADVRMLLVFFSLHAAHTHTQCHATQESFTKLMMLLSTLPSSHSIWFSRSRGLL